MAWRTTTVEIDGKPYTAREPSCGACDRLATSKEEGRAPALAFVLESLRPAHPDITAETIVEGMPPRDFAALVKAIMDLGQGEAAPGEATSA